MKIVIIGGGKVGTTIASQLTSEGHDITVIDTRTNVLSRISDTLDVMTICGNGASLDVMREADVGGSELLIACTAQDELNMLCCVFAKRLGCKSAIARVRSIEYVNQLYYFQEDLGLSMTINPERYAAKEMFNLLEIPGVLKRDTFCKGRVEIVEVIPKEGDLLDGLTLMDLPKKLKCKALVGAVQRGSEVVIPDGRFSLKAGDRVYICAPSTEIVSILRALGEKYRRARNVVIIGGSRIADYLTYMLIRSGVGVKIIERSEEKARMLAEHHPKAVIVRADGTSEGVLRSERVGETDAVVTLTGIDEENLVLSMYLTRLGVPQVLTKVDHTEFGEMIADRGVNRMISPKKLCADAIVQYVRAMQNSGDSSVVTLHHLIDGKVEALEFNITAKCAGVGKTLREIKFKPNILLACVSRRGQMIIPDGNLSLEVGDNVVVIASAGRVIVDINDIFAREE